MTEDARSSCGSFVISGYDRVSCAPGRGQAISTRLGARTLLGVPGLTTRNKKLLGARASVLDNGCLRDYETSGSIHVDPQVISGSS